MYGADKSHCFKVIVAVRKPLRCGLNVKMDGKSIWIYCKFINYQSFSLFCGKLGDVLKGL